MDFSWIEKIDVSLYHNTQELDFDNEYFEGMKNRLDSIISNLKDIKASPDFIDIISDYTGKLIGTIEKYYEGNIIEAQIMINNLMGDFKDDVIAVTNVNDCIAFPKVPEGKKNEVQFFRARIREESSSYDAEEMLHIPFSKRSIVKSGRFSIPGLPCLYLGITSYVCWVELDSPPDHQFDVSAVRLDNSQKVLNLAMSLLWLQGELAENNYEYESEKFVTLFKLLIISLCTSYRVKEENRNFKSEYILSQLLMLSCKNMGLDGVLYYSKRIKADKFANPAAINLALFASYENGKDLSPKIRDHIEISDSLNYGLFRQLLPQANKSKYDLRINYSSFTDNMHLNNNEKMTVAYQDTKFCEFDNYLFSNF